MSAGGTVVLLHGLARGPASMAMLAARLRRRGFETSTLRYPSRPPSFEAALTAIAAELDRRGLAGEHPLCWVGYSLGALLVRAYVAEHERRGDRVVMLAPPNGGSALVDTLGPSRLFRWAFGELACELGTSPQSLPRRLPVPSAEVGVIAGRRWVNPLGPLLLDDEHDGTVSVESTRLAGMRDHLVLPHTHTFLLNARAVAAQTAHFFEHGRFERDAVAAR